MPVEKKTDYLQAAFSVSIKNFKKAVERNRIKRLMREAYRLQKVTLKNKLEEKQQSLLVFIIYTDNKLPEYKIIYEKMGDSLDGLKNNIQNLFIKTDQCIALLLALSNISLNQ